MEYYYYISPSDMPDAEDGRVILTPERNHYISPAVIGGVSSSECITVLL